MSNDTFCGAITYRVSGEPKVVGLVNFGKEVKCEDVRSADNVIGAGGRETAGEYEIMDSVGHSLLIGSRGAESRGK